MVDKWNSSITYAYLNYYLPNRLDYPFSAKFCENVRLSP